MTSLERATAAGWRAAATLSLAAGLCSTPATSSAQAMSVDPEDRVCGELEEQPESALDLWLAYFSNYFPLSSEACDKVSAAFVRACGRAVEDAAKCQAKALKSVRKGGKAVCKAQGGADLDDACNSDVKQVIDQDAASIEAEAADAIADCVGEIVDDFMDLCRGVS